MDIAFLRRSLAYEPSAGEFTWLNRPDSDFASKRAASVFRAQFAGKRAFTAIGLGGYRITRLAGQLLTGHRAAFALMTGRWPVEQMDHINGDRADNRWANLREADQPTNSRNMAMPKRNTSGRVGVTFDKRRGKWFAQGRANHRQFNLGRYDTIEEAIAARETFEREQGFHPNHGRKAA